MTTDDLEVTRRMIARLSPDELRLIRDDVAALLLEYETGGALTGRGYLEVKKITRPMLIYNPATDKQEPESVDYFYCYVRREIVKPNGKRSTATVGYYGKAGVSAMGDGRGDELLEAHLRGGEAAGDEWLYANGYDGIPNRKLPPEATKPPESRPVHPLGNEAVNADQLTQSPVFHEFMRAAPVEATALLTAVRDFERDLASFTHAQTGRQNGQPLIYRTDNQTIQERRKTARRRDTPPRPRRISRKD